MSKINPSFFDKIVGDDFIDFFNKKITIKPHWTTRDNGDPIRFNLPTDSNSKLKQILTQDNIKLLLGTNDITIYQFLMLVSIMINETGGKFNSISEIGSLEYMFKKIPKTKVSYNVGNTLGNKTCLELFSDPTFINVPYRQTLYKPKNMKDPLWGGSIYPTNEPKGVNKPSTENYKQGGLISECDFYKFRGRGLIQTTGRGNYSSLFKTLKSLVDNSQLSESSKKIIRSWGNDNIDIISTKITNLEIDTLFNEPLVLVLSIKNHYSIETLKKVYNTTNSDELVDLIWKYGKRISGGDQYATHYTNRVFEIMEELPNFTKK